MRRARWLEERDESLARSVLAAPLVPVAWAWSLAARAHRAAYARGVLRVERLPCSVIAVGSPLVGGASKTPVAARIAHLLARRGFRVAIVSGGYGRKSRGAAVEVVSDGERLRGDASTCGDEPLWLAARVPGVPVLVAARRADAGRVACAVFGADVVVLDDGLHHHALAHDVGIACVPGGHGLGNGRVLPRGPLRESVRGLAGCDAVVSIDGEPPAADAERLREALPQARSLRAVRTLRGVRALAEPHATAQRGGERSGAVHGLSDLAGVAVGVLAGIARPRAFVDDLRAAGLRIEAERFFADHHRYRERDLRGLRARAAIWLTTEKDALKLRSDWARRAGIDLRVVESELRFVDEERLTDWLEVRVRGRAPAAVR